MTSGPLEKRKAHDFRRVTPNKPNHPFKPASRSEKKSYTPLVTGAGRRGVGCTECPLEGRSDDRFWVRGP